MSSAFGGPGTRSGAIDDGSMPSAYRAYTASLLEKSAGSAGKSSPSKSRKPVRRRTTVRTQAIRHAVERPDRVIRRSATWETRR